MRIGTALLFVLMLNVFVFLGATSMEKVNPELAVSFFNYEGSWLEGKDRFGNFTLDGNLNDAIPDSQSTVGVETGNVFTDTWRTISGWLTERIPGYSFMERMVNGPYVLLSHPDLGIPAEISFAVTWIWHMLGIFLFVAFIRGGAQI